VKKKEVIDKTVTFVKTKLADAEGGHDWWHISRVWNLAKYIAQEENVNLFIVELGALLHDIADSKFNDGDEDIGPRLAKEFLSKMNIEQYIIDHVEQIILNISFKGGNENKAFTSLELDVVRDADILDAMGAIGIARAFNYGGFKNRKIYDPNIPHNLNMTNEEYKTNSAPTINHFYEKLLLLKDRMNTNTGYKLAEQRHSFMEQYLLEFYDEWDGIK